MNKTELIARVHKLERRIIGKNKKIVHYRNSYETLLRRYLKREIEDNKFRKKLIDIYTFQR